MPQDIPDFSMAGREPPDMGPMAHGFAALGEGAERAVDTLSALAADAAQAPSRLGDVAHLLTSDGKRIQSFWFRFSDYKDVKLCLSFDGYQGVQLGDKQHALWCRCK